MLRWSYHGSKWRTTQKIGLILFNQSEIHYFCNQEMVTNICNSPTTMKINTNAGNASTNLQATLPGLDDFWFDNKDMVNVLSLALIADSYQITYNSSIEPAFLVMALEFTGELKACITVDLTSRIAHIGTDDWRQKSFYTDRKIACAKRARESMHPFGMSKFGRSQANYKNAC